VRLVIHTEIGRLARLFLPVATAAACAALSACGGGSAGPASSGQSSPPPATPTTGTVGVLLGDGPSSEFCRILATVGSIDLLGANGPTSLFTGSETVDVLAMRNYSDFFAIDPAVPVGSYEKIRLTLTDLALVRCDDNGDPVAETDWEHPKLPGNGKLDLSPRGSFQVVGGETLIIELDMDMDKSLHLHQTGNGKWQFRPVVFVDVVPESSRLVRVFGQVRDAGGATFELCPLEPVSSTGSGSNGSSDDMSGDDDSGRCIDVFTDDKTGFFGENGLPGGTVANGGLLTAVGFLGVHDDDDDNDSRMDDLRLDAVVLEFGDQGTFDRPTGTVVSTPPGIDNLFAFDPDDYQPDPVDVRYQSGTRIFALGSNEELGPGALQPGTIGQVDGVLADADGPLNSALIVLDQDTTPQVSLLDATITGILDPDTDMDPATREFTVDTADVTGQCVRTDANTVFLMITETPTTFTAQEQDFSMLAAGDVVDVYGSDDGAGCLLAGSIQEYE
jgi:hypothetical protein